MGFSIAGPRPLLGDAPQLGGDFGRRQQPVDISRPNGALRHVRLPGRLDILGKHNAARFLDRLECRRAVRVES